MPGSIKIVGIVSALESEVEGFKEKLEKLEEKQIRKHKFNIGYLKDTKIVFVNSGIGKVNAAITTQILIDNFNPDIIINTGIAGGLNKDLRHTDLVVANKLMYHDFDKRLLNTYFPFVESFKVEEDHLKITREILKNEKFFEGLIITGDQFVVDSKIKEELKKNFDGICIEMEGAAIAHTAYANCIPFIVIRCISDLANDDGEDDYNKFEVIAAKKASDFTIEFIGKLK